MNMNDNELNNIDEAMKKIHDGVEAGMTQEELHKLAAEYGIDLDPNYLDNYKRLQEEQEQGEEKRRLLENDVREYKERVESDYFAEKRDKDRNSLKRRLQEFREKILSNNNTREDELDKDGHKNFRN